jgi:hypothetical protein
MNTDLRPFHDHAPWRGPCSTDRHAAIMAGVKPHGRETEAQKVETAFRVAIEHTRATERGIECACCRHLYAAWVAA